MKRELDCLATSSCVLVYGKDNGRNSNNMDDSRLYKSRPHASQPCVPDADGRQNVSAEIDKFDVSEK